MTTYSQRHRRIPKLSEAEIAEGAKQYRGDTEKVATTPITSLSWRGVTLSSRYGKAHELEIMASMVEMIDPVLRPMLSSIWCDSKGCAFYEIEISSHAKDDAELIGHEMDRILVLKNGGYNGISIKGADGLHHTLTSGWVEPSEEEIRAAEEDLVIDPLVPPVVSILREAAFCARHTVFKITKPLTDTQFNQVYLWLHHEWEEAGQPENGSLSFLLNALEKMPGRWPDTQISPDETEVRPA